MERERIEKGVEIGEDRKCKVGNGKKKREKRLYLECLRFALCTS